MAGQRKADPALTALLGDRLGRGRDRHLWRSLEELSETPEVRRYLAAEFPGLAHALATDRRGALRLMGASLALAGLSACDHAGGDPNLVSRGRAAPGHTPGEPLVFATTLELDGYGRGVLVESYGGRPTKIEGNPLHPATLGATDVFLQAEILSLYDPDRSRAPREGGRPRRWDRFWAALAAERAALAARGGEGLRVLTGTLTSPSLAAQLEAVLAAFPQAQWHQYTPVSDDNARAGARLAFGEAVETLYDLSRAEVVLTLGGDLLGAGPGHVRYARDFAAARRADGLAWVQRLYAVEAAPSLTGARADHRLILRPSEVEAFARAVAAALGATDGAGGPAPEPPILAALVEDLRGAGPHALAVAGREQPPAVHALAHAINAALGAAGQTAIYTDPVPARPVDGTTSLRALADDMAAGAVSHLFILDGNPAYAAPADLDFPTRLAAVPFSVHLGLHEDETAALCRWHLPRAHALESWGDARAFDGTVSLRQPVRPPSEDLRGAEEILSALADGAPASGHEIVRAFWLTQWGEADFEPRWRQALHDGVVADTALPPRPVALRPDWDAEVRVTPTGEPPGLEVLFAPDPSVWDGRYANNAWLQELPRPLTKLVWDNAALMAPATAERLGLRSGDVVQLTVAGRGLHAPVWAMPGHAPDTVTLPLGYGRTRAGRIGTGVGFDAYRLRTSDRPWFAPGASLTPTGDRHRLVTTQDHNRMDGRDIVRAATLAEYRADPEALGDPPAEAPPSIYPDWPYPGHAWGMAIDLDACLGCNACAVACQAENNVPVVGKEEVARHREMHWLRVDRYHEGPADAPLTHFQPMLCMHCEKAPCEVVCPVNATVHDSEGLNAMVYNRCIGTRTCSNNCPYKVRRFNWFNYATEGELARPDEAFNPDVTVRARGVMEKCTYCVQRISAARIAAKRDGRPIRDGEVVTACQQACPTRAIVFGDLNDPDSAVSRLKASPRDYALLGEINTRPRTTYLARLLNPHPDDDATEGGADAAPPAPDGS
ncbi:MAG TPA: TAT-variant-translocated molybdopterin oxidoreductase [Geminicoccaceae bacterium]|nr:TAT-variant-translocated molybdopterin oxidoreductase [Geminicoccaceae bacterium]